VLVRLDHVAFRSHIALLVEGQVSLTEKHKAKEKQQEDAPRDHSYKYELRSDIPELWVTCQDANR